MSTKPFLACSSAIHKAQIGTAATEAPGKVEIRIGKNLRGPPIFAFTFPGKKIIVGSPLGDQLLQGITPQYKTHTFTGICRIKPFLQCKYSIPVTKRKLGCHSLSIQIE